MTTQLSSKPAPLGRGLSALFGDADASYQAKAADPNAKDRPPQTALLAHLQPSSFQPRRIFDEDALKELANSIRERGILEPILVRPAANGKTPYEIIAGERRWRAAQLANLHEVPVLVRVLSDREALEFGIIENVQREDLSPLEEAGGYRRLMGEFGHTQDDLAKVVGKSRSHISNLTRLLDLPEPVRQMIDRGELSAGHARALAAAKDPLALAEKIVERGLNVRQAEALAKRDAEKSLPHRKKTPDANILALEKELEQATGLKVAIAARGKGGSLTLHYQSLEQLEGVVGKLRGTV